MMDKIAIFCSASENIEPVFFEKARELGVWMGQTKKTLVYGGANIGLMECIAKAAKDNGSMIMGVIPTSWYPPLSEQSTVRWRSCRCSYYTSYWTHSKSFAETLRFAPTVSVGRLSSIS